MGGGVGGSLTQDMEFRGEESFLLLESALNKLKQRMAIFQCNSLYPHAVPSSSDVASYFPVSQHSLRFLSSPCSKNAAASDGHRINLLPWDTCPQNCLAPAIGRGYLTFPSRWHSRSRE